MAVTQPTVKSMRQGTKLLLGKYSANKDAEPVPIAWTKATPNGDFIASFALDYLCADARERQFRENGTSYHEWWESAVPSIQHTYISEQ